MTAPDYLTWDAEVADGGARRPSLADVGGATLEDEAPLPDESSDWTAAKGNQWQRQVAAIGGAMYSAAIEVRILVNVPYVYRAIGPGTAVVAGLFTVTDNGTGDTTVAWPVGALPIPDVAPSVSLNGSAAGMIAAEAVTISGINRSVRIRVMNSSGVAADLPFTLVIH